MLKTIFDPSKQNQDTYVYRESIEKKISRLQYKIHIASKEGRKRNTRDLQRLLVHVASKYFGTKKIAESKKNQKKERILVSNEKFETNINIHKNQQTIYRKIKYLKCINPLNQEKIQQVIWNLALTPALVETPEQNYGIFQKCNHFEQYHKLLQKTKKIKNIKWILKIESQKLLNDIPLEWIIRNTPLEKSILKYYLKSTKGESKTKNGKSDSYKNEEITSSIKKHLLKIAENFLKSQNGKEKNNTLDFKLISDENELNIVSASQKKLSNLHKKLTDFFNLSRSKSHLKIISASIRFKLFEWNFHKLKNKTIITCSEKNLKNHKKNLKTIIKSTTKTPLLISRINALNEKWKSFNRKITKFQKTLQEINIYTFKLLWHWARRKHSSKGNLWIFHKYWKKIECKWKFTAENTIKTFPCS